jgi:periplasmic divalent cation tolerance protein
MSDVVVVYVTAPDLDVATRLGRALVEESLAACCNLLPGVRSIYQWEGAVQEDAEVLLVLKTVAERVPALTERVLALHPYTLPEVIALPVTAGHTPYLEWVRAGATPKSSAG